ncbi:MAG: hypothetical protein HRU20_17140 [Pseudomonadales bacterium]|nr:hypothetical protein [Pseudomonadales bacterium]
MNFEEMSEEEILSIATPIIDNYMDASTKIDHERHIRDFTDRLKEIVTPEHLQTVCERYQKEKGFFDNRELVKVYRREGSALIVWSQTFTKVSGEYLVDMILVNKNGKFLVDHTWML